MTAAHLLSSLLIWPTRPKNGSHGRLTLRLDETIPTSLPNHQVLAEATMVTGG